MINTKMLLEMTDEKTEHFTAGKFEGPTREHKNLIDNVLDRAQSQGHKAKILITGGEEPKPLEGRIFTASEKKAMLQRAIPQAPAGTFITTSKEKPTIFHHLADAHERGVKHVVLHFGSDRIHTDDGTDKEKDPNKPDTGTLAHNILKNNGNMNSEGKGYKFKSITFAQYGKQRKGSKTSTPGGDIAPEHVSSSNMRASALAGDHVSVKKMMHSGATTVDAKKFVQDVQSRTHGALADKKAKDDAKAAKKNMKESLEIGDYVTNGEIEGEILNLHPKYATIISEGKEYRFWIDDLELSENQPKRDQLYKDSFIYKGYKTKNFNRPLSESFKEIANESDDEYAVLACLKAFDYVLGVDDTTIAEDFNTVRIQIERLHRYAKKINCPYLVEKVISTVEEELLKYAVLEDIRYTTVDRNMIAKVIGMTANINISNAVDPTNIVNQAAIKLKTQQLTPMGWKLLGRLMNIATKAGIKWQKDTFAPGIKKEMGLIE